MRVVVTRPVEDAERIAAPLRDRGLDVMVEPLLAIVPRAGVEVDTSGIQATLLTSANGVRALVGALGRDPVTLHIPALAVGDQTATVARELGFADVRAADGDVTSLAALVRATLKPDAGPLLHAAGSHVAGDLAGDLAADGYTLRRVQLYESRTAAAFSADLRVALTAGTVDAVLLYSPRTAKTFATLAEQGDLRDACSSVTAYCLSPAVAEALGTLPFAAVRVAPRPEQDALLALFDTDNHSRLRRPADTAETTHEGERTMSDRPEASGSDRPEASGSDRPEASGSDRPETSGSDRPETSGDTPKAQGAKDSTATGAVPPSGVSPAKDSGTKVSAATDKPEAKPDSPAKPRITGADQPQPSGKSGGGRAAVAIGAVLLILVLLYASLPWWRGSLPPEYQAWTTRIMPAAETDTALQDEIADLRQAMGGMSTTVRSLESRLDRVEQQAGGQQGGQAQASQDDLAALRQQVEKLAQASAGQDVTQDIQALGARVGDLENSRAAASTVLSLSDRVNAVEAQVRNADARQERALSFLMSVLQLREALLAGRPFDAELRAVRATAPQDFELTSAAKGFIEYADAGVPPLVVLRQRLNAEADQIIRASAQSDETDSWLNRTMDRALSVVSVRRTDGEAVGDTTASVVSRAEQRLAAGNLSGAVGELRALEGAPAETAAPWLKDARARLAADAAVSELTAEALARVGAGRPTASGQEG